MRATGADIDNDVRLPAHLELELVLLDRDGVLNLNLDQGVRREADWVWLPGAPTAARLLAEHGVRVMVATNQANFGRGLRTAAPSASLNPGSSVRPCG